MAQLHYNDIKRMDIKEFRDRGYLQELNRRFLHPLGLALEVIIDYETDEEKLGGIWDFRDDPAGIHFNARNRDEEDFNRLAQKAQFIEQQIKDRYHARVDELGYFIEPIYQKNGHIHIEVTKAAMFDYLYLTHGPPVQRCHIPELKDTIAPDHIKEQVERYGDGDYEIVDALFAQVKDRQVIGVYYKSKTQQDG